MSRKKFLTIGLFVILLTGIALVTTPFLGSMRPNSKAYAALPRIDISDLKNGEAKFYEFPRPREFQQGYALQPYIYKTNNGEVRAWKVPRKENGVGMPDIHWWRPFYLCKKFGLTNSRKLIKCHDKDQPSEWWGKHWQWDLNGKNIEGMVGDMLHIDATIEDKYFVYGNRS